MKQHPQKSRKTGITFAIFLLLACLCLPLTSLGQAAGIDEAVIPSSLMPWRQWVLHGYERQRECITSFQESTQLFCSWPVRLTLAASSAGGEFVGSWVLFHEEWVALPGGDRNWPHAVEIDGTAAPVVTMAGAPSVRLTAGSHTVTGRFTWESVPEYLQIPLAIAFTSFAMNGEEVLFPDLDNQGRLWLQSREPSPAASEDRMTVRVFRRLQDSIPLRSDLRLVLDVAGKAREVLLGPIFPAGFIPLSLDSPLPGRIEEDGRMRLQLHAGSFTVKVAARHDGRIDLSTFTKPDDPFWPADEIWSFQSEPSLRMIEVSGGEAIDPQQTDLPAEWRNLPAYRLRPGDRLTIKEIRRGDPDPGPDQLTLSRRLWLRFDGQGMVVRDQVSGKKNSRWRLVGQQALRLGRVSANGQDQLITTDADGHLGVELRRGEVELVADAEMDARQLTRLPATGWEQTFNKVALTLNLPPGWQVLHVSGADRSSEGWISRWTLLDIFLVLLTTVAAFKVLGPVLALITLSVLGLCFHEPGFPVWSWLLLFLGIGLRGILPEGGSLKRAVSRYLVAVTAVTAILLLPFMARQLRIGIYPQLERPYLASESFGAAGQKGKAMAGAEKAEQAMTDTSYKLDERNEPVLASRNAASPAVPPPSPMTVAKESSSRPRLAQYDPKAPVQTGPGLPAWNWNEVQIGWSGPVQEDQTLGLYLLSPRITLLLALIRVAVIALLCFGLGRVCWPRGKVFSYLGKGPAVAALFLFSFLAIGNGKACAEEIPSPEILKELRERLLEKPDCFGVRGGSGEGGRCAEIDAALIRLADDSLVITMTAAAAVTTAMPLPGEAGNWLARSVTIDGEPASAVLREGGRLWVLLREGVHKVELSCPLPRQRTVQLSFPMPPHDSRVVAETNRWTVKGLKENGRIDGQLILERIEDEKEKEGRVKLEAGPLPPFLQIERQIVFDLAWKVMTTITRLTPARQAVSFDYTLLPGEAILTEGIERAGGMAKITLRADQSRLALTSTLDYAESIGLEHSRTTLWTERWQVEASPVWHLEYTGLPVIFHQNGGQWLPTWYPWPGEKVQLVVTRPQGAQGQTLTVDLARLALSPGRQVTDAELQLTLRSSQGGQHSVTLPEAAVLQAVVIGGKTQPIRQEGRKVVLPITPGTAEVRLQWRQPVGIAASFATPAVDLGTTAANVHMSLQVPADRWLLFIRGPVLGPAVLFYSVLAVIVLAAIGLGLSGLTPLKVHHFILLGLGLSQSGLGSCLPVVVWLMALQARRKMATREMEPNLFKVMQVGLALLTVFALATLVNGISGGLLGDPDMSIIGNGSHRSVLHWYQDRSDGTLMPAAMVVSVPILVYRGLMLAWSLWISFGLVRILKWGWEAFATGGYWPAGVPGAGKRSLRGKLRKGQEEELEEKVEEGEL